ncbi:MAG: Ig-like domain-containing protein [Bacteroidales bacterium]|nr:Ig-like domain-containing protein [Bacteroidales bacterium]
MKYSIIFVVIMLCFPFPVLSQGWECAECPKRDIGLFDLDVWIENPAEKDSSIIGQFQHQLWVELFMVAGGIHEVLFNEDPSKECLIYYDGQMAVLSDWDQGNYTHGKNQASLPPAPGLTDAIDYWITGVIAKQEADDLTVIQVYVQASGTGETAVEASALYDYNISGMENGKRVAQQLLPLMEKIRDFEKRKRDEEERIAIGPYEGATLELKPAKEEIETDEKVDVNIRLLDCDDVPLKNMEVRLEARGGTFNPAEVTTDDAGEATAEFKADNTPGKYKQPFDFEFRYPFSNEFYTSGDEGYITIVPIEYDAIITISKKITRKTSTKDSDDTYSGSCKTHYDEEYRLDENIEGEITLILNRIESQEMPIFNQTWEYYQPVSVNISSFSYTSRKHSYSQSSTSGVGCASGGHETTLDNAGYLNNYEIEEKEAVTQFPWMLVIDNETEKAVKLIPAGYNIKYEIHDTENLHSIVYSDKGPKTDSKTTHKTSEKSFALGPVAEEIPDPTIKPANTWIHEYLEDQGIDIPVGVPIPNVSNEETIKEIHPDILVKSGDGKTSFGGDGSRRIRKELEDGYDEQNLHYNWSMTVKKRK